MNPLKKLIAKAIYVITLSGSLLFSCTDSDINELPTEQIAKVETEYLDGAVKMEGMSATPKVETSLGDSEKIKLFSALESKSNDYLKSKRTYNPTARIDFGGYDVGVFPMSGQCPAVYEQVEFFMDCEDSNGFTRVEKNYQVTDDQYAIQVDGNRNIHLIFCRVDGRFFKPFKQGNGATFAYGLLRLGNISSVGIQYYHEITRNFDNEDSNYSQYTSGDIGPNAQGANTILRIAVIQSTPDFENPGGYLPQGFPTTEVLGGERFGVFANSYINPSGQLSDRGYYVSIDDEDNRNANYCKWDTYYNYQNNSSTNSVSWLIANSNSYFNIVYPIF